MRIFCIHRGSSKTYVNGFAKSKPGAAGAGGGGNGGGGGGVYCMSLMDGVYVFRLGMLPDRG